MASFDSAKRSVITINLGIVVLYQAADSFRENAQSKENAMASPFDPLRPNAVLSSLMSSS